MKYLTIVVILVFGAGAIAQAATYDIPLKGLETGAKILVNVNDAQINVVHSANSKSLQISLFEAANEDYMVQSNSGLIEVRSRSSDREQFGMKPTVKKRIIEIRGPSMALEIHAFEGSIQLSGWDKEAVLHLQKGKIAAKNGKGSLALHSQTGEISVLDHQGRVEIDTYKSNITLKNLTGDADLENFSGETIIEKASGGLNLRQGQGSAKVIAGNGALQFDLVRGSLSAQKFQGRIEGVTLDGPVSVTMAADNDVNVRAQTAKVTVQSPANSGAALNLSTMEGDLNLPQSLKASRDGAKKTYRGRLKGADQKGSITVRSQEGLILIR
jgi:DUF4097 and DUF4098 domain-containing protein YvlB